jgi:hypothetical protein
MPTPEQRQHFADRLAVARKELAAELDPEAKPALEAMVAAYETLMADMDRIERLRAAR